jgi:hypothetical protein
MLRKIALGSPRFRPPSYKLGDDFHFRGEPAGPLISSVRHGNGPRRKRGKPRVNRSISPPATNGKKTGYFPQNQKAKAAMGTDPRQIAANLTHLV